MSSSRSPQTSRWPHIGWRLLQVLVVAGLIGAAWFLLQHAPYRIDIDVYRMGGRAWLDGRPLYSDGTLFHTRVGLNLPFTYPPLAAIVFSPFAWLSLPAAGVAVTLLTLALLVTAMAVLLTRLGVRRSVWLAAAIVVPAAILIEPIRSNFNFGQINVVLMMLVIADCVPRRTSWPRGLLLGLAIALKLTPAVFLLYFILRRDGRTVLTAAISFLAATAAGFALAWRDSWEYWTSTVRNTDRIGRATLNTNQNIAGALARVGLGEEARFVVWTAACFAVLAVTVWAVRRVLRAQEPMLALMCVALFGLTVSPVSWSHHWVWVLPTAVVTAELAYRRRSAAWAVMTALGVALMVFMPFELMPKDHEPAAALWRQLAGLSYVWWALAVIVVSGFAVKARVAERPAVTVDARPVPVAG